MMLSTRKILAATLGLALLLAVTTSANAQSRYRRGGTSTKEKIAYIGGGAAAGALIGGLIGGKKGAVIGGLLGAGGGTGVVLLKGRNDNDRYGRYYGYRDRRAWDDRYRDANWRYRDRYDRYDRDRWSHNRFRR